MATWCKIMQKLYGQPIFHQRAKTLIKQQPLWLFWNTKAYGYPHAEKIRHLRWNPYQDGISKALRILGPDAYVYSLAGAEKWGILKTKQKKLRYSQKDLGFHRGITLAEISSKS